MTVTDPEARLLIVEDEPNIRELLATSLQFAGFEVVTAGDGKGTKGDSNDPRSGLYAVS